MPRKKTTAGDDRPSEESPQKIQAAARATEIEQALLGRLMRPIPGRLFELPHLPPGAFGKDGALKHATIYRAIMALRAKGEPCDEMSVIHWLRGAGLLDQAGGIPYIGVLQDAAGPPESVAYYVETIRKHAARRTIARIGQSLVDMVAAPEPEDAEASPHARVETLLARARVLASWSQGVSERRAPQIAAVYEREQGETDWTIQPWLAKGETVIVAGEPGTGKSLLMLQLSFCLAMGQTFIDPMPVNGGPYKILYLDAENPRPQVTRRVQRLSDGLNIGKAQLRAMPFWMEDGVSANLDDKDQLAGVLALIRAHEPDFIVLDSFVRFHRKDENSNSEMRVFFAEAIRPMAEVCGSGVLLIHHLAKPAQQKNGQTNQADVFHRVRGAGDIMAAVDQVWGLERADQGLRLRHLKCRWTDDLQVLDLSIEEVNGGNGVLIKGVEPDMEAADIVEAQLMRAGPSGVLRQTIVSALEAAGISEAARLTSRHLGRLYHTGSARKAKDGRSVRYWWVTMAPESAVL